MKTVASPNHVKHFPRGELAGGELVRPYECPERWDYIMQALQHAGLTDIQQPQAVNLAKK